MAVGSVTIPPAQALALHSLIKFVRAQAQPLPGEFFVFTRFSGQPQCFLTVGQLASELRQMGCSPDTKLPVRELTKLRYGDDIGGGRPPRSDDA